MYQHVKFEDGSEGYVQCEFVDPFTIFGVGLFSALLLTTIGFDISDKIKAKKLKKIADENKKAIEDLKSTEEYKIVHESIERLGQIAEDTYKKTVKNIEGSNKIKSIISKLGFDGDIGKFIEKFDKSEQIKNTTEYTVKRILGYGKLDEVWDSVLIFNIEHLQEFTTKTYDEESTLWDELYDELDSCVPDIKNNDAEIHIGTCTWAFSGFDINIKLPQELVFKKK